MNENITGQIAEFVANTRFADLPDLVINSTKRSILDTLGVMIAGGSNPASDILIEVLPSSKDMGQASYLGTSLKGSSLSAAFINGTSGHSLEYDDTQITKSKDIVYGLLMHPTVPVFASVLAAGEKLSAQGSDLLAATVVGVEVACQLAQAIDPSHYDRGLHCTGTFGTIGAAAAVSNLLDLDLVKTEMALGIAASLASGLRENFGTMTKPLHAGHAAHSGLLAAMLASGGFTAASGIMEAPRGFSKALSSGWKDEMVGKKLGNPFVIEDPGIALKAYPCGTLAQPAIDIVLNLRYKNKFNADDVSEIRAHTNSNVSKGLLYDKPQNSLEARFSFRYCVAVALQDGRAGLSQFDDQRCVANDVQNTLSKVKHIVDPLLDQTGFHRIHTRIEIYLKDGQVLRGEAEVPKGHPENPLSIEEIANKLRDILHHYELRIDPEQLINVVFTLEKFSARDVARLGSI